MSRRAIVRRLLTLAASLGLASCAVTDPTQYYTLGQTPASRAESTARASTARRSAAGAAVGIGVGPVIIPAYLDRSQIVTRRGPDHVELSMFHRWAEPLEDGIARVLGEEIGARVPTERIVMFPWRGAVAQALQYQVVIAVLRFDGRAGAHVTLDTRWRILGQDGGELAFGRSTVVEATADSGHEALVAAMTRTVRSLGQEIAAEIRAMPR
jgi:uncharacterized lipoprotein YmbA